MREGKVKLTAMTSAIDRIADALITLETQLSACTRCGACQAVCPVFLKTGREADTARGKLALLDGLSARMFEDPTGVMNRLERCLLCGACQARCPAHVGVIEIFSRARFIIKDVMGLSPLERIGLRLLLAVPGRFDRMLRIFSRVQHGAGVSFGEPKTAASAGPASRMPLPLAPTTFQEMVSRHEWSQGESGSPHQPTAVFFPGCLLDKFFPHVATAAVTALRKAGVRLVLPSDMGCCGMPAVSMGDLKTFSRLVRYHVNRLATLRVDHLVTACPTCTTAIKTLWPTVAIGLSADLSAKVKGLADKAIDISRFLIDIWGTGTASPAGWGKTAVTYHDPCHLKNSLRISREPRQLITASPRFRLVEMAQPDSCCGMGGTFRWKYPELASQLGTEKRDRIIASGASMVATACPACMMQLTNLLAGTTPPIRVKHVIELHAAEYLSPFSLSPGA